MTALNEQTEERIGNYRVHPVASMFPLLAGEPYEELRVSIEEVGQLHPIIVMGDTLLDGRNRLRVCLEVGIEPRIEEYRGPLPAVDYIQVSNIDRRHLSDDARVVICAKINQWILTQSSAKKKAAQGHHGAEGGRGKKTLTTDSALGFSEPKTRARDARSTVGQIAEQAQVSHHKAAQAVAVAKAAPDLLSQVTSGEMKLKDAYAKVREAAPEKPPKKPAKPRRYDAEKAAASCARKISAWIAKCPAVKRAEFKSLLLEECKQLCGK